jgi:hypothetical protein
MKNLWRQRARYTSLAVKVFEDSFHNAGRPAQTVAECGQYPLNLQGRQQRELDAIIGFQT